MTLCSFLYLLLGKLTNTELATRYFITETEVEL